MSSQFKSFPDRQTKILVLGATGYIGGAALMKLLDHPDIKTFNITAFIRSPDKGDKLKKFGITPVIGSLADVELIEQLAADADVLLSMADSDDVPAMEAILRGLRTRHQSTGVVPVLIHTSGTGVLTDDARGMYAYDTIWDDANISQMASLAPEQPHRVVDLLVVAADRAGYARTYIILPSTIYGLSTGPLIDAGISNPRSIQIPNLIRAGADRGQGGIIGEGKNLWPDVHIDDLADLYIILFDAALHKPEIGHGIDGYYFAENGEHQMVDVYKAIADALVAIGKANTSELSTFTNEEIYEKYTGSSAIQVNGTNSRCRANHSRQVGWDPKRTIQDLFTSILPEAQALYNL